MATHICAYEETRQVPCIIVGPLTQSSPLWPGNRASPETVSTTLASRYGDKIPTEPLYGPFIPFVVDTGPASVIPYPYVRRH